MNGHQKLWSVFWIMLGLAIAAGGIDNCIMFCGN